MYKIATWKKSGQLWELTYNSNKMKFKGGNLHSFFSFYAWNGNREYIALAYRAPSLINSSNISYYVDVSQFYGATIKFGKTTQIASSFASVEETSPTGISFYNETRKLGVLVMNFYDQNGSPRNFTVLEPKSVTDLQTFVPNIGTLESGTAFWNRVEEYAYGSPAWKDATSTTGGGKGNWDDDDSDQISDPDIIDLNANNLSDTMFVTTYRLDKTEIKSLGGAMWSNNLIDGIKNLFSNPLESIISLYMLPFDNYTGGKVDIKLGTYNTGVKGYLVGDQYKEIPCGSISIPEKWGGALDYETRIQLYLPFIGTKELDTAEVMGSTISIKYVVDTFTGTCVAYINVNKAPLNSILYQYTGNCAYSFPLTQANYNTFYSSLLSATATIATEVATGGASTPMLVSAGASVAMSAKPHINHSGNLAGNAGYMGIKKPYIILSRPIQALPADFGKYKGYQSHITKKLSECNGYTEVEYIHLDGINRATSAELAQIESLLKGGVIIS